MPAIDLLPHSPATTHNPLGPIPHDESSNSGNLDVIHNIFSGQYALADEVFDNRLVLLYGDQKTVARIRGCKKIRQEDSSSSYESLRWALEVPALFHLKMNYLKMMVEAHFDDKDKERSTTNLYTVKRLWNRNNVLPKKWDFFSMEEFIVQNYQARVAAFASQLLGQDTTGELSLETDLYACPAYGTAKAPHKMSRSEPVCSS